MVEIDIYKPYDQMKPAPGEGILAIDFNGSVEYFRYEELCSRYNRLLEEVRYLTSINDAIKRERDSYTEQVANLENALQEMSNT